MDKNYWDKFYGDNKAVHYPSSFAELCVEKFIDKDAEILELGAGNGRDSFFFAEMGNKIWAVDQSINESEKHLETHSDGVKSNISLISTDFTNDDFKNYQGVSVFYSRFTIHAIKADGEDRVINNVYNALPKGGKFLIETRTTLDPLCGQGEKVGENTYKTDHRRRFIDSQAFVKKCLNLGFQIRYFTEEAGLSIFGDDDPVLMRLILIK